MAWADLASEERDEQQLDDMLAVYDDDTQSAGLDDYIDRQERD